MSQKFYSRMALGLTACLLAHTAFGLTIPVADDVEMLEATESVNKNFGASPDLGAVDIPEASRRFCIRFDLASSLPSGIASNQVRRALLRLYVNRVTTPGPINIYPPLSYSWSEGKGGSEGAAFSGGNEVTWTHPPLCSTGLAWNQTELTSFNVASSDVNEYITFDVTDIVKGWIEIPAYNLGLLFGAPLNSGTEVVFDSKENPEGGHGPELDLELETFSFSGGSLSLVGPSGTMTIPTLEGIGQQWSGTNDFILQSGQTMKIRKWGDGVPFTIEYNGSPTGNVFEVNKNGSPVFAIRPNPDDPVGQPAQAWADRIAAESVDFRGGRIAYDGGNAYIGGYSTSDTPSYLLFVSHLSAGITGFTASPAQTGQINYTLPASPPTSDGQVLTTTAGGVWSWSTPAFNLVNPAFEAPTLGAATATSLNGLAIANRPGSSLTIGAAGGGGKSFVVSNSLSFTGTDGTSFAFPSASGTVVTTNAAQTVTNKTIDGSANALIVKEANLSLQDDTVNNASTAKHGLLPKLPGDAGMVLNGAGVFVRPLTSPGVAFIRADGDDATGVVGDPSRPYQTAQAAYDTGARTFDLAGGWSSQIAVPASTQADLFVRGVGPDDSSLSISGAGTVSIHDTVGKSFAVYLYMDGSISGGNGGTATLFDCYCGGVFARGARGLDGNGGGDGGAGGTLTFYRCSIGQLPSVRGGDGGDSASYEAGGGAGGAGGVLSYYDCYFRDNYYFGSDYALEEAYGGRGGESASTVPRSAGGHGGSINRVRCSFADFVHLAWTYSSGSPGVGIGPGDAGYGGSYPGNPSGLGGSVNNASTIPVGQDEEQVLKNKTIDGNYNTVTGADSNRLQGRMVSSVAPSSGQALVWDGAASPNAWKPNTAFGTGTSSTGAGQVVVGQHNDLRTDEGPNHINHRDGVFVVGSGASGAAQNAMRVVKQSNGKILVLIPEGGDISMGGFTTGPTP